MKHTASQIAEILETYEGLIRQLPADQLHSTQARALFERWAFWKAQQ